jgi:predicted O-methyltransferase YrrM
MTDVVMKKRIDLEAIQRRSVVDSLLPFIADQDKDAPYLISGNYYEWYAGMASAVQPKAIAEIGVRYGYSSMAMLASITEVTEVQLLLIDNESSGISLTQAWMKIEHMLQTEKFPISVFPTLIKLDSRCLQPFTRPIGQYDLIHIDGGHDAHTLLHDLDWAMSALVREGGLIVVDDCLDEELKRVSEHYAQLHQMDYRFIPSHTGHVIMTQKG